MKRQPRLGARVRRGGGRLRAGAWLAALALATLALLLPASGDALAQQHPQVGGLRLSSEEPGVLTVEWEAADPEPVDYRVNWARPDQDYPTWTDDRGNAFPTTNSLTLNGLEAGAEYKVQVRARYGAGGSGPWSEEARLSVAAAAEPGADSGGPGAPLGLEATLEAGGIRLSWQAPSGLVTGYQIERWRPLSLEGAATRVEQSGSAATQYLDGEALQPGVRYRYRVRAWRGAALGPASAAASESWYPQLAPRLERDGARGAAGQLDGGLAAAERLPGQLGACGRALSVLDGGGGQRLSAGHRVAADGAGGRGRVQGAGAGALPRDGQRAQRGVERGARRRRGSG